MLDDERVQRLAGELAGLKRDHSDQFAGLMEQISASMDQIGHDGGKGKPALDIRDGTSAP